MAANQVIAGGAWTRIEVRKNDEGAEEMIEASDGNMYSGAVNGIAWDADGRIRVQYQESPDIIGYANQCSFTENFGIREFKTLGYLGPKDLHPMDYSLQITMNAFVPRNGASTLLTKILPKRQSISDTGGSDYFQIIFRDLNDKHIFHTFHECVVSSVDTNISSGELTTLNITFMGLERT